MRLFVEWNPSLLINPFISGTHNNNFILYIHIYLIQGLIKNSKLSIHPRSKKTRSSWLYRTYSSWTYRGQIQLIFHAMGDRDTNPTTSRNWLAWGPPSRTRASAPTSGPPARRRPRTPRTASPASGTTFCWSRWRETTFSEPPTCTAGTSWCVRWVETKHPLQKNALFLFLLTSFLSICKLRCKYSTNIWGRLTIRQRLTPSKIHFTLNIIFIYLCKKNNKEKNIKVLKWHHVKEFRLPRSSAAMV